ncbi:MAG: redoxin domain-containing protein [Candidatus Binataceae bacterium]
MAGMKAVTRRAANYAGPVLNLLAAVLMAVLFSASAGAYALPAERIPAPDFTCKIWLNSPPLTLRKLRGEVVLIDFWDYTCINCIRTFPYLRRWHTLYHPLGLEVIGVHTPEFAFAKNVNNAKDAVKRFGFTFPIAVDNGYKVWDAFHNQAWPADYLIDKDGRIAAVHIGEGDYGDFELEIQKLLKEANPKLNFAAAKYQIPKQEFADMFGGVCHRSTPETYLGYARGLNNDNPGGEDRTQAVHYVAPSDLPIDQFALNGDWLAGPEFVRHLGSTNALDDSVALHYQANSVYLVAGSDNGKPHPLYVTQDGKPLPANALGVDVKVDQQGRTYIMLNGKRMYYVVNSPVFGQHTLRLYATTPNVSLYSFTFGNNCENKFAHR